MIITLFLIATITFFLMKLLPGSPYANEEKLTDAQIALMNQKYGLDKPVFVQYLIYLKGLLVFDLGMAFQRRIIAQNAVDAAADTRRSTILSRKIASQILQRRHFGRHGCSSRTNWFRWLRQ